MTPTVTRDRCGLSAPITEDTVAATMTIQEPIAAPDAHGQAADPAVRVLAFYLPQFHPIPENDAWWGEGFTEWTNVKRATAQFAGHDQPRIPGALGYYDLRDTEVQAKQIELARSHGIHGFCYHYYWFDGHRLLDRPLGQILANPDLDFPFCICWANENWTRSWDGRDDRILIAQNHSPEDDLRFITELDELIHDPRYITVDGRPVIVVYRPQLLPDPTATAERWKAHARARGNPEPYLVNAHSFPDVLDPRTIGFDASVEFPPHQYPLVEVAETARQVHRDFKGRLYDYRACVAEAQERIGHPSPYPIFPGVMPGWDNTPRRMDNATIFTHATPEAYGAWVEAACRRAARFGDPDMRLVFVNAWNEWGEGAYLEPDTTRGHALLRATAEGILRAKSGLGL